MGSLVKSTIFHEALDELYTLCDRNIMEFDQNDK